MSEKLLDTSNVSELLGVTKNTLQIWRHQGKGPKYIKLSKRAVRYRESDVVEWVNHSMIETECTA